MHIETTGAVQIRHRDTGVVYEIDPDELDWNAVSADDEPMGARVQHVAEIEHEALGPLSWTLWEYPEGVKDYYTHDIGPHELLADFDISLLHDPEDSYDDDFEDSREDVEWASIPESEQVESIVSWFNENYEDPQNEMPYADKEADDNYEYPWGGPYNAEEEIRSGFEGKATENAIRLAVEKVTDDGTFDWAPTSAHPDRRRLEVENYEDAEPEDFDFEEGTLIEEVDGLALPSQRSAPLITFERNGRVARQPTVQQPSRSENQFRRSGHAAIVEALDDFEASFPAHNHAALSRTLVRLRASLGPTPDDIDVVRLGTAAERINQYALRADEMLVPAMAAEVTALNLSLAINLTHFEEWTEYRVAIISDTDLSDASIDAAQEVIAALAQSELLEPEVKDELEAELVPFILPLEGERGTPTERKTLARSLSNTLVTVARITWPYLKKVGEKLMVGHMGAWEEIGKNGTMMLFSIAGGALSMLVVGNPYFGFLIPILNYLNQFLPKK